MALEWRIRSLEITITRGTAILTIRQGQENEVAIEFHKQAVSRICLTRNHLLLLTSVNVILTSVTNQSVGLITSK